MLAAWKRVHFPHSRLQSNQPLVATKTTKFLFGGYRSGNTYEYLPKGSYSWLTGWTEIPGGFSHGCAIAVESGQEIWLLGGLQTAKRILSFNVNDHTFKELQLQLNFERFCHSCDFIPNTKKVMLTGGFGKNSTEILDTEDESVTMASPMNSERYGHGMGVLTIEGEDRLAVFGGFDGLTRLDTVELYNAKTEKWEPSDIKLNAKKYSFGYLTVKLSDIVSELHCNKN